MVRHFLAFIILLLYSTGSLFGQDNKLFILDYNAALPLGDLESFAGNFSGRGVSIDGRFFIQDNISLGYFVGWNVFFEKEAGDFVIPEDNVTLNGTQQRTVNTVPIQFQAHYYTEPITTANLTFYGGLGTGLHYAEFRTETGLFVERDRNWPFSISPSVGVLIPVNYSNRINAGVRFNQVFEGSDIPSMPYLVFTVGYGWFN